MANVATYNDLDNDAYAGMQTIFDKPIGALFAFQNKPAKVKQRVGIGDVEDPSTHAIVSGDVASTNDTNSTGTSIEYVVDQNRESSYNYHTDDTEILDTGIGGQVFRRQQWGKVLKAYKDYVNDYLISDVLFPNVTNVLFQVGSNPFGNSLSTYDTSYLEVVNEELDDLGVLPSGDNEGGFYRQFIAHKASNTAMKRDPFFRRQDTAGEGNNLLISGSMNMASDFVVRPDYSSAMTVSATTPSANSTTHGSAIAVGADNITLSAAIGTATQKNAILRIGDEAYIVASDVAATATTVPVVGGVRAAIAASQTVQWTGSYKANFAFNQMDAAMSLIGSKVTSGGYDGGRAITSKGAVIYEEMKPFASIPRLADAGGSLTCAMFLGRRHVVLSAAGWYNGIVNPKGLILVAT